MDVSYEHDIPSPGCGHKGLAQTLREMFRGGSVEVPFAKRSSVYSSARAAGVKVRLRATEKSTVRVWRIDGPERPKIPNGGLDIFGQPLAKSKPGSKPGADPYGPSIFVAEDGKFTDPVVPHNHILS